MAERLPERVRIVEVGPRDGLQNEPRHLATSDKLAFIQGLVEAGLQDIEAAAFVHPGAVPQLEDAEEVVQGLPAADGVTFSALVPNERGLERALSAGIQRIAVFTAASETFTSKNIRMTIADSLETFAAVVARARDRGLSARGYVSTAFVCPYEGDIDKQRVLDVTEQLLALGVDEVAISDTIGAAAPTDVFDTIGHVLKHVPADKIALHFHDTYGTALANIFAGLQLGITTFDAAAGGLGGCPFAQGAAGNVATEDVVHMLGRMGINSGIDVERLAAAARDVAVHLGRAPDSRFARRRAAPQSQ